MTTAREYLEEIKAQAIVDFAGHELRTQAERHWSLGRPGTICYFAEVFAGQSHLYVGGDIDSVVFGYFSGSRDPLDMLHWIGCTDDVGYYVKQKAGIGLSDGGKLTEDYDKDVARHEIGECLREELKDTDSSGSGKRIWTLQEALGLVHDEGQLRAFLYEETDDPELASSFGWVCDSRVVYAWAAVRRLCELLGVRQ